MADDNDGNEDSWLYGSSNPEPPEPNENGSENDEEEENNDKEDKLDTADGEVNKDDGIPEDELEADHTADEMEEQETAREAEDRKNGDLDSDDSDDDINVVIGDIKSGPSYNIKQRGLLATNIAPTQEKPKQSTGKFSIEEFESVGTINGVQAHEFSIDSLDEKPWRKPGADITDYFNYGFNEDTWRSYCERQKKMRLNESGVGLQGLALGPATAPSTNSNNRTLTTLANDNSKYTGAVGTLRRAGPPPGRKMTGSIDVIGGNGISSRREDGTVPKPVLPPAKENVIQVMTADRREYSRPGTKFDASVPPPFPGAPPEPFYDHEAYHYGYEPTQDSQWINSMNTAWTPTGIKELTPGPPQMVPPPVNMPPPMMGPRPMGVPPMGPTVMNAPPPHMGINAPRFMPPMHSGQSSQLDRERDRDRDRDRERDREREKDRERDRERERGDREIKIEEIERVPREREDDSPPRERDRDRDRRSSKGDRYRERRRERSRSRERSRRRSRSRDREHRNRDKKKSHKKDKDDSD